MNSSVITHLHIPPVTHDTSGASLRMAAMSHIHGQQVAVQNLCWLMILPSGYAKIALENDPFIVDLPINNSDFPWLSLNTRGG